MIHPYMTLADETEIVHSQVFEEDGDKKTIVHFERATEHEFDSARCELPSYRWILVQGIDLMDYIRVTKENHLACTQF